MRERLELLCRALRAGQPAVTALVTGCRGATPRAPGALLVLTAGPGMRLLPPLVITKDEMDKGLAIMKKALG